MYSNRLMENCVLCLSLMQLSWQSIRFAILRFKSLQDSYRFVQSADLIPETYRSTQTNFQIIDILCYNLAKIQRTSTYLE